LAEEISKAGAGQGERLREGLRVAIAGPPNAGKSTLFNRLARREAAIVSPFPGTTRDVLELHLDLGGYPVTVLDTAGIRETNDPIEREGVRRASEQAASANLVLWVIDATAIESRALQRPLIQAPPESHVWLVVNKMDLVVEKEVKRRIESGFDGKEIVNFVSSTTGAGVDELVNALARFAGCFFTPEPALVTRERQRAHLKETVLALQGAQRAAQEGSEEIMAEQLRLASRALGKLLGRVDVEDVLDVIFRDFCIGK
jgi:tRNA modification GTPase